MIIVDKTKNEDGISLKGDFFDLDRLYFAILKYTGFHGIDQTCTFPGYDAVCENLLGLCYEIRHAWQGDRNLEQVYNGIQEDWFDDSENYLVNTWNENSDEEAYQEDQFTCKFSRKNFPQVTKSNTYFSIPLGFPEATFYSLILVELLEKKDIFLQARKQLAEKIDNLTALNKEYYFFQANEDIARITLLTNQILHTLYRFIGEEKYTAFMNAFTSYKDFFFKCDLKHINSIIAEYDEKDHVNEDPDFLYRILLSFFE